MKGINCATIILLVLVALIADDVVFGQDKDTSSGYKAKDGEKCK